MTGRVNYAGLLIAGVGFFLTRFTVTLAIYEDPVRFYFAGVVPLVLGLGLAAFGVALAVADVETSFVRTTATWCVVGLVASLAFVVLTVLGSAEGLSDPAATLSRTYLSNFLIGGSVGGTLTGLFAAHNRRQHRELANQANRLEVLNRLLRHEILNAVMAIRGYAALDGETDHDARAVIQRKSDGIAQTVEEVRHLTRSAATSDTNRVAVGVDDPLRGAVETVREEFPAASIAVEAPAGTPVALANSRLELVFTHLLRNAVTYSETDDPRVEVTVTETPSDVRVSVRDEGPGLPESQQRLLETGDIGEFDDPRMGYGLNIVRLLVESYRGSVETRVGQEGTTVTVVLRRAEPDGTGLRPTASGLAGVRVALPQLLVTLGAAVVAGVVYGVAAELLGGSVAVVGVFYGVENGLVGWITHQFHSVVFGFAFVGIVSLVPLRYRGEFGTYVAVGAGWGLVLWFVAAGVVSSLWLRLLGIPAPLPSLSTTTFVTHLLWGVTLGVLTALGYEYVTPWLARMSDRTDRRSAEVS